MDTQDIFEQIATQLTGYDAESIKQAHTLSAPLDELVTVIHAERPRLAEIQDVLTNVFVNPSELYELQDDHRLSGTHVFIHTHQVLNTVLSHCIKEYMACADLYINFVQGKLDSGTTQTQQRAVSAIHGLFQRSVDTYIRIKKEFPKVLEHINKDFADANKYLRARFVKSDDEMLRPEVGLFMNDDDLPVRARYIKIKLVEDNPVLTDMLLDITNDLPPTRERIEKKGKKTTKKRELSAYAIINAAERLITLSDPKLLGYAKEARPFFDAMARAAETFYAVFQKLEPSHQKIMASPMLSVVGDVEELQHVLSRGNRKTERELRKLQDGCIEPIVQREDDVLPENKRETDHFKLREKMLSGILDALRTLPQESDETAQQYAAKNAIVKAVEIQAEIQDLLTTNVVRRLREDKRTDNEHYVGRQGHIGEFYFERAPTPKVKMNDVIGKSFAQAKDHIGEIIDTSMYPHVMQITAPGGKVRSNILMIGPYGCGKTELARAACADERVIGASVSITSMLTAYMHESVNNVKRVYDAARRLYMDSKEEKPVLLVLDEFDGLFVKSGYGFTDTDMQQIENVFLEVLDGMEDYNGIITIAMTNRPKRIPKGILRRFRYVDIVGELTEDERAHMLKMYLEKRLPVTDDVGQQYQRWAKKLDNAPGDVVRKIVDEVHFALVPEYIKSHPKEAARIEQILRKRETKKGTLDDKDILYVRECLSRHRPIGVADVDKALEWILCQPPIRMQIDKAKRTYESARALLDELGSGVDYDKSGFGFGKRQRARDGLWGTTEETDDD